MERKLGIVLLLAIIANLIGAYFGFFVYYQEQIAATPVFLLAFVADCPLAVLLVAASLFLVWIGKKNDFLSFLASAYALKYGFWTVFVILYFNQIYFAPAYWELYAIMLVTHFGMMLESFALVGKIEVKKEYLMIVLGWFLLNDYMDYFWGLKPWTVPDNGLLLPFTLLLSIASVLVLYLVYTKKKPKIFTDLLFLA
ncbi:MAG: DUF1405 domain-containing protein [Candidatus Micrarchaeota archaeon]|nr:DUF1405 domain-containing protein [Candidatus Micrarchaeota archaeon]